MEGAAEEEEELKTKRIPKHSEAREQKPFFSTIDTNCMLAQLRGTCETSKSDQIHWRYAKISRSSLHILHFLQAAKAGGAGGLGAFVPAVVVLGLAIAAYFFLNNNA